MPLRLGCAAHPSHRLHALLVPNIESARVAAPDQRVLCVRSHVPDQHAAVGGPRGDDRGALRVARDGGERAVGVEAQLWLGGRYGVTGQAPLAEQAGRGTEAGRVGDAVGDGEGVARGVPGERGGYEGVRVGVAVARVKRIE